MRTSPFKNIRLIRYIGYALERENYPLLWRTLKAAWQLRRVLSDNTPEPRLLPAILAARAIRIDPQPGWSISQPDKILLFASWAARQPPVDGRCVQQSLIAYRLLNGYGIPARICYGVSREHPQTSGHAWVEPLLEEDLRWFRRFDTSGFQLVYASDQDHNPR